MIDDTKGIIDEDKPIKLVIIDEATEFFDDGEGEAELANIEAHSFEVMWITTFR